ncbi:TetR/AcrR family transcriptional regulator [Acetobacterium bakii]|uniref:HTH tetR-type domain-containing protein n=1 Tax=Acetobacterium bakii TaxID=52689 RepID=A0A0L6U4P7_9FIRM|nr:TetR/AcrR family transcriptional regulator [Acetobacterium bakii]KNZ43494.1 hypothetical protein AKG39_00915 [Acetobacterium bakii]
MAIDAFEKLSVERKDAILKSGIVEFSKKSYTDASTEEITKSCGISKGILFHYFGNKKEFYLYCLEEGLKQLVSDIPEPATSDFYGMIFSYADEKYNLCRKFPHEMRFANMAAREMSSKVFNEKNKVLGRYMIEMKENSQKVMARAVNTLNLKEANTEKVTMAISMYVGALINKNIDTYKETPDLFFEKTEEIKAEMKEYIDLMLIGVVKEVK